MDGTPEAVDAITPIRILLLNMIWPISIIWTVTHDGLGNWFYTNLTQSGKVHS